MVTNTPEHERGRIYDNVENVQRIRPSAEPKREGAQQPENPEKDFEQIPW
jgi:hypothetical protein